MKSSGMEWPVAVAFWVALSSAPLFAESSSHGENEGFASEGAFQIPPDWRESGQALFVSAVAAAKSCPEAMALARSQFNAKAKVVAKECRQQGNTPRYQDAGADRACAVVSDSDNPDIASVWAYVACLPSPN